MSRESYKEFAEQLLCMNANDLQNGLRESPLMRAVKHGNEKEVVRLIKSGADLAAEDIRGWTALHFAAYHQELKIAKLLIRDGADVTAKTKNGFTPLHYAADKATADIMQLLLDSGARVNVKTNTKVTPLHLCTLKTVSKEYTRKMRLLLNNRAHVNAKDNMGNTPLHYAAWIDNVQGAKLLLQFGANKSIRNNNGDTPVHIAGLSEAMSSVMFKKKRKELIANWTQDGWYRKIQDARRKLKLPTMNYMVGKNVIKRNAMISQYMRNAAWRAPQKPPKYSNVRYLWRGVHGDQADEMRDDGYIDNNGYIAFSRNEQTAINFVKYDDDPASLAYGFLMRLDTRSIPKGTPWIWFDTTKQKYRRGNKQYTIYAGYDEAEVLLPPGRLQLQGVERNNYLQLDIYVVKYIPHTGSTSLLGKPIVQRRKSIDTSHENAATQWFSTLFNNTKNTNNIKNITKRVVRKTRNNSPGTPSKRSRMS